MFNIVLYQPEIPPNTGNIMRLCANTDFRLHLIEPLGFDMSVKSLRRAGMDYSERVDYTLYPNFEDYLKVKGEGRIFLCTTKADTIYSDIEYLPADIFVFGPETRGLPTSMLNEYPAEQKIKVPMTANGRSLNLANCVSIVAYEAWRQHDFKC